MASYGGATELYVRWPFRGVNCNRLVLMFFSCFIILSQPSLDKHNDEALHVTGRPQCRFNLHRLRLFNTSLFLDFACSLGMWDTLIYNILPEPKFKWQCFVRLAVFPSAERGNRQGGS